MNHRTTAWLVLVGSLLLSQRALAAWPHDPGVGVPVQIGPALEDQISPVATTDGAGGMIVAWVERTASGHDIYAQRVSKEGNLLWAVNGAPVCTAALSQDAPVICPDGVGGAILAWIDRRTNNYEIYAQRINALGAPQWAANGVLLATGGTARRFAIVIVPSGTDGAIVAWIDARTLSPGIYARRVDASGAPQWTANGVVLSTGTDAYSKLHLVSDGKGGAIMVCQRGPNAGPMINSIIAQRVAPNGVLRWGSGVVKTSNALNTPSLCEDARGGAFIGWYFGSNGDLWGQHVDSTGTMQWGAGGLTVATSVNNTPGLAMQPDGADGVYMVWGTKGQRLNGAGTKLWNASGVQLISSVGDSVPQFVGDGVNGGRLAWSNNNASGYNIFAQRFDGNGAQLWSAVNVTVSNAPLDQTDPVAVADGLNGTMVVFQDTRLNGIPHVYAARIDQYGFLADVGPTIVSVRDVAQDQGGHVRVSWLPSALDATWSDQIESYRVLRRTAPGVYTEVGSQPSLSLEGYSMVVATAADSVSGNDGTTAFVVRARYLSDITKTWDSAPDSGHSVDNLPPNSVEQLAAQYDGAAVRLTWRRYDEPDLAGYRVYRGPKADFVPGPDNLLAEVRGNDYADSAPNAYAYKVVAVDAHGNASPPADVVPEGALLAGVFPAAVAFAPPHPNPARGTAELDFALPHAADVRVALYDVGGKRVRSLDVGTLSAGAHVLPLALEDDHGAALASGVYLTRLECAGTVVVRRLAVVR